MKKVKKIGDWAARERLNRVRNCLIMGSGRSGTSMLAGMLHQAGYFMGEKFHQPRDSNPKGFFEWYPINRINEAILAPYGKNDWPGALLKKLLKRNTVGDPGPNQRWLMTPPEGSEVGDVPPGIEKEMKAVLEKEPYAYKDPRFSYTLPAWRPFLKPGTIFLCIFREPAKTVASILKECRSQKYLSDLSISRRSAYRVWTAIYRNIIDRLDPDFGNFIYVHYDQVFEDHAIRKLADALQAKLANDFADPLLARSQNDERAPQAALDLYARLCRLAHYEPR